MIEEECRACKGKGTITLEPFSCSRCGNEIPRQPNLTAHMDQGLDITLSGGYGEYIDGYVDLRICKDCCDVLKEQEAWFRYAIEQQVDRDG